MSLWLSVLIIFSLFAFLLYKKVSFKSQIAEIVELKNEFFFEEKKEKINPAIFNINFDPTSPNFATTPSIGHFADAKIKIHGLILKTIFHLHSLKKIYVGEKIKISYLKIFKFKIIYEEQLLI